MESQSSFVRWMNNPTVHAVRDLLGLLASIGAVIAIFYGAKNIQLSTENDRRQTTLNVLKPTREAPVLESLHRLRGAALEARPVEEIDTERLALARDILINTYDSVSIHFDFGVVDRCVVKAHVRPALDPVITSLEYFRTAQSSYASIIDLRKKLDELVCHPPKRLI